MRFAFLFAAAWCGAAAAAPRATIELRSDARVQDDRVVLGQVAHLWSEDLPLLRKLVDLPIGRAPRGGETTLVQRETLARWIEQRIALAGAELAWRGADATRVQRATQQVRGTDIAAVATAALRDSLAARGEGGSFELAQWPRDIDYSAAGELRMQARPPAGVQLRNRIVVWVDVWAAASFVRSIAVPFDVSPTKAPIDGAAPDRGAMPWQSASIEPGAAAVLVARGAWATLRSTEGVVSLESRVEVLQDGRAGDRVRVRQSGATGVVFARVVGPSQLELAP